MYGIFSKEYDKWTTYYDPSKKEKDILNNIFNATQKDILDIGCGAGRLSFMFAKEANKIVGIDDDIHSIEYCDKKSKLLGLKNCSFICVDASLFKPNTKFDVILFGWSLYQIEDMFTAVLNATKLLKKTGILLILQPVGGDQEDVFDLEYKKSTRSYNEIYSEQVNICLKLFSAIEEHIVDTDFVYPSIDKAIESNMFVYKLFCPQFYDIKNNLSSLRERLLLFLQDNRIVLKDITKIIVCKGCDIR